MVSRTWYKGNLFEPGVQYPSHRIEQAFLQAFITFHILKIAPQLPSQIQLLQPPSDPFCHVHITFAKALQETQCIKNSIQSVSVLLPHLILYFSPQPSSHPKHAVFSVCIYVSVILIYLSVYGGRRLGQHVQSTHLEPCNSLNVFCAWTYSILSITYHNREE